MTDSKAQGSVTPVVIIRAPKKGKRAPATIPNDIATKVNSLQTVSAQIRMLHKCGYNEGQIADVLGIRYQHAYNVLHTVLKGNR